MEYVRESRFKRYMGTDENAIIQLKDDLTRKPGDRVTFANVRKLRGKGVTGNQVLEGNEEELDSRSMAVTVGPVRNAVVVTDWDDQNRRSTCATPADRAEAVGHGEDAKSDY